MTILAIIIAIIATVLLMISSIAFLRAKDLFTMTHILMIVNVYIVTLIFIALMIQHFSLIVSLKLLGLILINILVSNLICSTAIHRAISNKITPDIS